jgi:hypothetical protein
MVSSKAMRQTLSGLQQGAQRVGMVVSPARGFALLVALTLVACGPPAQPGPQVSATPAVLQPLGLPEVRPKPVPLSTVPVAFAIDRASVSDLLEEFAPKRQTENGRSVGHGIKLDLTITRGATDYGVKGGELSVEVPITLSIEPHRKIGPIDLSLGHCEPRLLAVARIDPRLSSKLTLRTPKVDITLKDRCNLSGFDVSSLIEEEVDKQEKRGLREFERASAIVPNLLLAQAKGFEKPLGQKSGSCPHLRVERLLQSPLDETDQVLSMTLGVEGPLVDRCEPEPSSRPSVESRPGQIRFVIATSDLVSWETLSRVLDPILAQEGLLGEPLRLVSAETPDGDRVALGVTSQKATGWVLLTPRIESNELRLAATSSTNSALLSQLQPRLDQVRLALPKTDQQAYARELLKRTQALSQVRLRDRKAEARFTQSPEQLRTGASAEVEPGGISLVVRTEGP